MMEVMKKVRWWIKGTQESTDNKAIYEVLDDLNNYLKRIEEAHLHTVLFKVKNRIEELEESEENERK